jgi:uncharacterized protein (DUF1697 family)
MPKAEHKYFAFLRGINNLGNKVVTMEDLKKLFEKMGFSGVKTVLASGNVSFCARDEDLEALSRKIADALKRRFGFEVHVLLRSGHDITRMKRANPFKGFKATSKLKLYVTLREGPRKPSSKIPGKIPARFPEIGFQILKVTPAAVYSVVDLSNGNRTAKAIAILEKEFGKGITTRNWNTILKLAGL